MLSDWHRTMCRRLLLQTRDWAARASRALYSLLLLLTSIEPSNENEQCACQGSLLVPEPRRASKNGLSEHAIPSREVATTTIYSNLTIELMPE